ncbi:MAG: cohesin domain-containing protein [Pseudomonadota bacterium]
MTKLKHSQPYSLIRRLVIVTLAIAAGSLPMLMPQWMTSLAAYGYNAGYFQLSAYGYQVDENNGPATIKVKRTGGSDGAVSVQCGTSDGTAKAGLDYIATLITRWWKDGDASDKTCPVVIMDDSEPENDETFFVSLGNPTGGAEIKPPDTAVVTIIDNCSLCPVILSVEPQESNVYIGQEFDVNILVKAGTQPVDGASAYLDFDPTYLEVVSMTSGGHLDLVLENSFDNGAGHIDFAAGKLTAPFPDGNFELVTIRLKAKAETSETTLEFLFNPPRRTNATFDGTTVFDHAENGILHISAGALVKGSVQLQGREPKPDSSWETVVRVSLTEPSETQPRYSFTTTTDQNGEFEVGPVEPLNYDMRVKGTHTLQEKISVSLVSGDNPVNVGVLLEGDANDDNCVTILDFSILSGTFGKCNGDGFDSRADFNQDDCVTILDFSLLAANFGQCGDPNPSMMVSSLLSVSGGTVVMGVVPATSQVSVGETFDVVVKVQAGRQEVDGASAYLDFDPTYLEVVDMTSAGYLDLTLENSFDNEAGYINFAAGKPTSPFPSGDFSLVTITLRAKAETSATSLGFVFNSPERTDATFGGASVFDYAEYGSVIITE